MAKLADLCRLLANELRLEILYRVYSAKGGLNVGYLVDDMSQSGLGQSGVSQYLKQLANLGVIRRVRAGKYVNYEPAMSGNPAIDTAIAAVVARLRKKGDRDFMPVFSVMMNVFRAHVVSAASKVGVLTSQEICDKLEHQKKYVKRDLQVAVDAGLLVPDDSDCTVYRYRNPSDPLVRLIISLF